MPRHEPNEKSNPSYLTIVEYIVDLPNTVRSTRIVKRSKRKNRKAWFRGKRH